MDITTFAFAFLQTSQAQSIQEKSSNH